MNLNEAYETLEISKTASEDEIKKKYRELTKKYHPDVNKDPDAEAKFKKINEAYNIIKNGETQTQTQFNPFNAGFNPFGNGWGFKAQHRSPQPIHLSTSISFKESIFGCKKEFKYDRDIKCDECDGQGSFALHNNCTQCNGQGTIVKRQGNTIITSTCPSCMGQRQLQSCKKCSGSGATNSTASIEVKIPGGVESGATLRLENMGNFAGIINNFFQSGEAYTDAFIHITAEKDDFFKLNGKDIQCNIEISLLEALKGTKKTVKTLDGEEKIKIKPLTKNNDSIILKNRGVSKIGNQIVNINVLYPDDIDQLVQFLEK